MARLDHRHIAIGACAAWALAGAAAAQSVGEIEIESFRDYDRGRNVGVLERPKPGYTAEGLRLGAWNVKPTVTAGAGYTDNVYLSPDKVPDGYASLGAEVQAATDWSRNALSFGGAVQSQRFFSQANQNQLTWRLRTAGRLDIGRDSLMEVVAEARKDVEARSDPSFPVNALRPVGVHTVGVFGRGVLQRSRSRLTLAGEAARTNYGDVLGPGRARIDQDFRDQRLARVQLRGEFAVSPSLAFFAQTSRGWTSYDRLQPGTPGRDSTDSRIVLGANFDIGSLMRGEVSAGYLRRRYDASQYGTLTGTAYSAKVEYFATPLLNLTLSAGRTAEDSVFLNVGGYLSSTLGLRLDYELRRNLILGLSATQTWDRFKSLDRNDEMTEAGVNARYLMNRAVSIDTGLVYSRRRSAGAFAGPEFEALRVSSMFSLQR